MNTFLIIIAAFSQLVLFYVYVGYPILLRVLTFLLPDRRVRKKPIRPTVSLIISCYNEEGILTEKLENSLALNYPEGKLDIYVVSDGSTDATDEIAASFADRGVQLIRVEGRVGKTACLNVAVPRVTGEIIVFSDANAIYEQDAIIHLVENFAAPQVGYVVGEARYTDAEDTSAAKSEDSYWQYEIKIKTMESRLHSVVGGDGAIYAIRKELYEPLHDSDINDFVNPLQIIAQGYRGVYEPEAICYENTSGSFAGEFGRKVRIVNRGFNGLLRVKSVLNPLKTGVYSLEIFSHKLLRWLVPYFLILLAVSTGVLATTQDMPLFQCVAVLGSLFIVLADIGYLLSNYTHTWPVFYIPYYFMSMNIAAFVGVNRRLAGKVQVTWNPPRIGEKRHNMVLWGAVLLQVFVLSLVVYLLWVISRYIPVNLVTAASLFWGSLFFIMYVYLGYPLVLAVWAGCCPRPVKQGEIEPEVALLICAYNEEEVIEEKIRNSLQIDYPKNKLQVIVASDGSTDATNSIVRRFAGDGVVLFAYAERTGKIGAILQTIPRLTSEILVFSDANTMYAPDSLHNLVRSFKDPEVGGVSADVILLNEETTFGESESTYYKYERWIQRKESEINSIIGADGGMYAIRRELFMPPSPNIILDDFVISMNVVLQGKRLVYEPDARGYEQSTITHATEFQRKSRVIAGAVQALKQGEGIPGPSHRGLFWAFVSHKLLRWLVPVMLILLFTTNITLCLSTDVFFYQFFLLLQVIFYLFAAIGWVIGGESRFLFIGIPFYFSLVNGAALYGLYKGCLNKQAVTWKKFSRKLQGAV